MKELTIIGEVFFLKVKGGYNVYGIIHNDWGDKYISRIGTIFRRNDNNKYYFRKSWTVAYMSNIPITSLQKFLSQLNNNNED